jgi:hypothetical protein
MKLLLNGLCLIISLLLLISCAGDDHDAKKVDEHAVTDNKEASHTHAKAAP